MSAEWIIYLSGLRGAKSNAYAYYGLGIAVRCPVELFVKINVGISSQYC